MEGDEKLCLEPVLVRVLTAYLVEMCRILSGEKAGLELRSEALIAEGSHWCTGGVGDGSTNATPQGNV